MGGCRCSYKNCVRATKNSEKDFHFFHYPVRDPERCLKWINNAKKPNFQNLPEDQLRNKVVCQLHFEQQYFTNPSRKRLIHNAVPTLDAGSEDTLKTDEMDVQVLQSDSEGNVFTVDTDNLMQTEVQDVTSYIIRNGNLVPADLPDTEIVKPILYKICVNDKVVDVVDDASINNGQEFIINKVSYSNHSEKSKNAFFTDREQWMEAPNNRINIETVTPVYESQDPLQLDDEHAVTDVPPAENNCTKSSKPKPMAQNNLKENSSAMEVVNLSKTIQQHSKEIACLKRILTSKMKRARRRKRLTNTELINNLRGLIPATLHGAVSLHLCKKDNNFSKDEKNFLVALYEASPDAYEILVKDCKWKLPDTDTVKKLIINKYCSR